MSRSVWTETGDFWEETPPSFKAQTHMWNHPISFFPSGDMK